MYAIVRVDNTTKFGTGYLHHLVSYDPATKKPYEYRLLGGASYELCATFDTDDKTEVPNVTAADNSFLHPAGPFCFKLDAGKTY